MTKADRASADIKLVEPAHSAKRSVECLPSAAGEISALASANAPFIYFDEVSFCSIGNGVAGVTLTASRQISHVPGTQDVASDRVLVAHLRGSLKALVDLRTTIERLEEMARRQLEAAAAAAEADAAAIRLPN